MRAFIQTAILVICIYYMIKAARKDQWVEATFWSLQFWFVSNK